MRVAAAPHVRGGDEAGGGNVQQSVYQAGSAGAPVRLTPVRQSRDCRAGRADQSHTKCKGSGAVHAGVAVRRSIERQRRGPCANRDIGEDGMERMSKPDTVQRILRLLTDWTGGFVRPTYRVAQWICHTIEARIIHSLPTSFVLDIRLLTDIRFARVSTGGQIRETS